METTAAEADSQAGLVLDSVLTSHPKSCDLQNPGSAKTRFRGFELQLKGDRKNPVPFVIREVNPLNPSDYISKGSMERTG